VDESGMIRTHMGDAQSIRNGRSARVALFVIVTLSGVQIRCGELT
jgi:hypothetical protein